MIEREKLVERFEKEMSKIDRPGMDKLMNYIRKSDFYTAPASSKYHLSCVGGLLQHSLNVLDAARDIMPLSADGKNREYKVLGRTLASVPDESITLIALMHDICKTNFYVVEKRNRKNPETKKWEEYDFWTIDDKLPLGHGDKSAMMLSKFIDLTSDEMYAIWWHMGFGDCDDSRRKTCSAAIEKHPLIWAIHSADMVVSSFIEGEDGNKEEA